MAFELDVERDVDVVSNLGTQLNIDGLSLLGLNHTALDVSLVEADTLESFILGQDFKFGFQVVLVDNLNLLHFGVSQKASSKLEEVCGLDAHFRH